MRELPSLARPSLALPPLERPSLEPRPRRPWLAALTMLLVACTPTPSSETPTLPVIASAPEASQSAVAAPPAAHVVPTVIDLDQVPTARYQSDDCAVDILPASHGTAVEGWLDAFGRMNKDGFSFQAPTTEAAAKTVLSSILDCETTNCDGPLLPVALSIDEEPMPAGYRVGIVEASPRGMFLYGPWEAGVQIYHCVPDVRVEVNAPDPGDVVQHVSVQSVQPDVVGVSADGECEPGSPDCNIGCFPQHVWRFDLYASTAGDARLLILQERSLPDDNDTQTGLLESLPPKFRDNDVVLVPCSEGE